MTEYLTKYMETVAKRLEQCSDSGELDLIMAEHKDKIAFMQHERIVHFLVTFMFAMILCIFVAVLLFLDGTSMAAAIGVTALVVIILVLEAFYIKHYYFLENTVQKMYRVYDDILAKQKTMAATPQRRIGTILGTGFFLILSLIIVFPVFAGLLASFRPGTQLIRRGLSIDLDVSTMNLNNYTYLFI